MADRARETRKTQSSSDNLKSTTKEGKCDICGYFRLAKESQSLPMIGFALILRNKLVIIYSVGGMCR